MSVRRSLCVAGAVAALLLSGCDAGQVADVIDAATVPVGVATEPATASPAPTLATTPTTAAPSVETVVPTPPVAATTTAVPGTETWTVTNIVDGDTVDVVSSTRVEERIRVVGIDTPERGECGFDEAADALARLVAGQTITLGAGAVDDRDRYGRLLRYVDVGTVDAGLELILAGHAIARYDSRDGYGRHPREDIYVAADAESLSVCDVPRTPATSALVPAAPSAASVQIFRNCADLNAVYPGGVARAGVTGNMVSGSLRPFGITPHFDDALYAANPERDGDKDGIACEK